MRRAHGPHRYVLRAPVAHPRAPGRDRDPRRGDRPFGLHGALYGAASPLRGPRRRAGHLPRPLPRGSRGGTVLGGIGMRRLVVLAACALTGCGVTDPYTSTHPAPRRAPRPDAPRQASPPPATSHISFGPQPTARAVIHAFATEWMNWSWRNIAVQQRQLASLTRGAYAAQLRADARHSELDRSLLRAQPEQSGTVVATVVREHRGRIVSAVVVTYEKNFTRGAEDAGGARYRVYLTRASQTRRGWLIDSWQPQP